MSVFMNETENGKTAEEKAQGGLRARVAHGLFWKLMELVGAQGIQFIVSVVLARLMLPSEYGTISLIMIFMAIANTFVQSGFATALVQKQEIREEDYTSVFRLCMLLSAAVYLVLFLAAPFIAGYYGTPVLSPLLKAMGIILFPGAVISIQTAYVSRNFDFRCLFLSTVFAVTISGIVSIVMAYLKFGAWAMAMQQIVYNFALMAGLFLTVKWRPSGKFSSESIHELYSFGWKILVSGLIDTVWQNVYGLIIGKRYSQADLGGYNRGEQFPKLITSNLAAAIQSVLLPAYAQTQDDRPRLKGMMKRSIRLSAFIVFPMMAGLIATATPLVRVLLTDKWLFSVPYLQIMCLAYAFWPIHATNLQMMNALGRSDLFLKLEIIKKAIGVAVLLISLRYGIITMLVLKVADEFLCTFINAYPNRSLIGYGILEQYADMFPSAVCAAAMGAAVWQLQRTGFAPGILLIIQMLSGVAIYGGLSYLLNRESMKYLKETVRSFMKKH
jgi:O-antigen/teichoic acid export membrane protein